MLRMNLESSIPSSFPNFKLITGRLYFLVQLLSKLVFFHQVDTTLQLIACASGMTRNKNYTLVSSERSLDQLLYLTCS